MYAGRKRHRRGGERHLLERLRWGAPVHHRAFDRRVELHSDIVFEIGGLKRVQRGARRVVIVVVLQILGVAHLLLILVARDPDQSAEGGDVALGARRREERVLLFVVTFKAVEEGKEDVIRSVGGEMLEMEVGEVGSGERAYRRMGVLAMAEDGEDIEEGWRVGKTVDSGSVVGLGVHGGRWARREMEMEGGEEE